MVKTWLNRLLLSYIPVFLIIVSVLLSILFFEFGQMSRKTAIEANHVYAEQVLQALDNSLHSIDSTMLRTIEIDDKIQNFFDSDLSNNPYLSVRDPSNRITEIMSSTPMIDSIVLFRTFDQKVMTPNMTMSLDDFEDKDFLLDMLKEGSPPFYWTNVREAREFQSKPFQVVSLVRKYPLLSGKQGLMIVNVKLDSIATLLSQMEQNGLNFIDLYDDNGQLLYGTKERSQQELNRVQSAYTHWTLTSGISTNHNFQTVNILSFIWLIIDLVVVLLGVVWLYYVTKRNYKPVEALIAKIQSYGTEQTNSSLKGKRDDEFQFIDRTLEQLMEKTSTYEQTHAENRNSLRQSLFMETLDGDLGQRAISEAELKSLHVEGTYQHAAVAIVEIDGYPDFSKKYGVQDQNLFKFVLFSVVQETAESQELHVWMNWTNAKHLTVLHNLEGDAEGDRTLLTELYGSILTWVSKYLPFSVTIAIGPKVDEFAAIHQSYTVCLDTLSYKSALGAHRIIGYWETESKQKNEMFRSLQFARRVVQLFRLGDADWRVALRDLRDELQQGLYARDEVASMLNYLSFHLYKEMTEMSQDIEFMWDREVMPSLHYEIESFETLEGVAERFRSILSDAADRIHEMREKNSNFELVKLVRQFIEEHYAQPDLSLSFLSNEFKLNEKVLSRLFKEGYGEKFIDYVAIVRVEHAKRWLAETEDAIQDIGARVGYLNTNTFIRAFKKVTGLTPGEFRRSTDKGAESYG